MSYSPLQIWFMAARPQTLFASVAPVLMGTAMAFGDGVHHFPTALVALVGAIAIQIGTNLVNDYGDFKRGADTANRLGPTRVTQAGLVTPKAMITAIAITFFIAITMSILLIQRAGMPIVIISILAIISAIIYTAGPFPLAYRGLGELFVFIFFGPVAVAGTYYVQSLEMNLAVILAGVAPGLLSAAILVVNNIRDINEDRVSGKKTLVVRFGLSFAIYEYLFFLFLANFMPVIIYFFTEDHIVTLVATVTSLLAIPVIINVLTHQGPALNQALADTARLLMIFSILFSLGWIV